MGLQIIQIVYWLALATWFGGALFVALSAPVIFRTVRQANPMLPTVLSVNLEQQHATLLAGSVVGELLRMLRRVEVACAAVLLVMLVLQWVFLSRDQGSLIQGIVRSALYLAAVALVVYDLVLLSPRIGRARQEYVDNADDPDVANPAKDLFDRYHRESVSVLAIELFLLLGMILFSAGITFSVALR